MTSPLDWNLVEEAGRSLGVKERTLEKWRERGRGVPFRYWLPISRATAGKVSLEALESFKQERKL